MKASLFSRASYRGPATGGWPAPTDVYSTDVAMSSYDRALDLFGLADELGFDWVTVAEHHFSGRSMNPNPMVMAGALTQRVKRAKIALLGPNVPILNPLRVAEEYAMLDTLSGGRIIAGMMRGTANEYVVYGNNPSESRERFEEALSFILKAWTEPQPFGWQGRYFEYRSVSIWPRPVQQPHPPIFMSGSSPESAEFAAKNHLKMGVAVTTVPLAKEAFRHYREQAHLAGWDPTPDDMLYRVSIHVAESDAQVADDLDLTMGRSQVQGESAGTIARTRSAVDAAIASTGYHGRDEQNQHMRHTLGGSMSEQIEYGRLLAGSPETVIRQIERIKGELDVGLLDLAFSATDNDATFKAVELFGTKVLPKIHEM